MGAGWQIFKIIAAAPFHDDETMDAIGRGQQVGLFTGKPKGNPPGRSRNETADAIGRGRKVGLFSGKPKD